MSKFVTTITLASCLLLVGCADQATMEKTATQQKAQDEKIQQLTKRVETLEQKPPEHHYELRNEGLRTWRFDPNTGDSCVSLTSKADWKNPETIRQGCQYQDYVNGPVKPGENTARRIPIAECLYVGKCDSIK